MTVRPHLLRRGRGAAAAALAAALALALPGQNPPPRSVPLPVEFSTGQDDNLFSVNRSQDQIHEWELGLAELGRGEAKAAVERLHRLLQVETGGVVTVGPGRFLGLRLAVVLTLANLPPAAAEAYAQLVRREAGALAERPLPSLLPDQLELLAERFPAAALGRAARLRLGDLALEQGLAVADEGHYRQALDGAAIGSDEERRIASRLATAGALARPVTARADAAGNRLPAAAAAVLDVLPGSSDPTAYPAAGGGDGRLPMAEPAGRPTPNWAEEIGAPGFEERESGLYAMLPVGDLDGVFVSTAREVVAFDPLRRAVRWVSPAPMREIDPDGYLTVREYGQQINQDMVLAPALGDDVVVAALQVPERSANVDFQGSFRIISKIPQRRLFAYARSDGRELWSHYDGLDGTRTRRFRGHDSCGPPLVHGDAVLAPMHDRSGAIAFAVAAYDLRSGQPRWRRLVCSSQQDVNMFGNARTEFAASPLCCSGGVVFGVANLGVAYALDAANGRIRWITSYEVTRMPRTSLHHQMDRVVFFANNAPVVADSVMCCTPLDSPFVLGLDAETGQPLWRLPAEARVAGAEHRVRWLCGALGNEFVLSGAGTVAVTARPTAVAGPAVARSLVAAELLGERGDGRLAARPAVTRERIWVPVLGRILALDAQGQPSGDSLRLPRYQPGNLLLVDGLLISLRQRAFEVFGDAEALRQRMAERLAKAPDDPAAMLRLASLQRALLPADASAAAKAEVLRLYERGLAACAARGFAAGHPVRDALQRELFDEAFATATAAAALQKGSAERRTLLERAREHAPDEAAWLRVQAMLLPLCQDEPALLRRELDRLEQRAAGATLTQPDGSTLPVRAYLLWQRAGLPDLPPAERVALWQELLEQFPAAPCQGEPAAARATAAIAALVERHGDAVYAEIAAAAERALAAAGDRAEALRALYRRYPNAPAAATARRQLLDTAVQQGDLGLVAEVLGTPLREGQLTPGQLRRWLQAALARGNRGLAAAAAARLQSAAGTASDWPADGGADLAAVLRQLAPQLQPEPAPRPQLPLRQIADILPRSARESFRLPQVLVPDGFARAADAPLFAVAGAELVAIDIHADSPRKPVLFALPVQFLEHVVLCGTTLVVPDLERVFAVDYRTGEGRWELAGDGRRLFDGLGVTAGVLHIAAQPHDQEAMAQCLGIEPLSGAVLWTRTLPPDQGKPKPSHDQLLVMRRLAGGDAAIDRLDPVDGRTLGTVPLPAALLQQHAELRPDGLTTSLYPQGLFADGERVFLPIDSSLSGDAPRLLAVRGDGSLAWSWRGNRGRRLLLAARHGDQVVLAEANEQGPGQLLVLGAADGAERQRIELGPEAEVLNWQRGWLPNPAPPLLALADRDRDGGNRRFLAVGLDGRQTSFATALGADDGEVERTPIFGDDFVTFGVRPAGRGPFRLYTLGDAGRSGGLPGGKRSQPFRIGQNTALQACGVYTVLASAERLLVLGDDEGR